MVASPQELSEHRELGQHTGFGFVPLCEPGILNYGISSCLLGSSAVGAVVTGTFPPQGSRLGHPGCSGTLSSCPPWWQRCSSAPAPAQPPPLPAPGAVSTGAGGHPGAQQHTQLCPGIGKESKHPKGCTAQEFPPTHTTPEPWLLQPDSCQVTLVVGPCWNQQVFAKKNHPSLQGLLCHVCEAQFKERSS